MSSGNASCCAPPLKDPSGNINAIDDSPVYLIVSGFPANFDLFKCHGHLTSLLGGSIKLCTSSKDFVSIMVDDVTQGQYFMSKILNSDCGGVKLSVALSLIPPKVTKIKETSSSAKDVCIQIEMKKLNPDESNSSKLKDEYSFLCITGFPIEFTSQQCIEHLSSLLNGPCDHFLSTNDYVDFHILNPEFSILLHDKINGSDLNGVKLMARLSNKPSVRYSAKTSIKGNSYATVAHRINTIIFQWDNLDSGNLMQPNSPLTECIGFLLFIIVLLLGFLIIFGYWLVVDRKVALWVVLFGNFLFILLLIDGCRSTFGKIRVYAATTRRLK